MEVQEGQEVIHDQIEGGETGEEVQQNQMIQEAGEVIQQNQIIQEGHENIQGKTYQFVKEGQLFQANSKGELFKVIQVEQNKQEGQEIETQEVQRN